MSINENVEATDKKILIVYYSLQGNTRQVAECIRKINNGTVFELELTKPYSLASSYTIGMAHTLRGHLPKLVKSIDVKEYDTIIIGAPVWAYTFPPPIRSFLKKNKYSLAGKDLAFFCTHAGNYGKYFTKLEEVCNESNILGGHDFLHVSKKSQEDLYEEVEKWLTSIGLNSTDVFSSD